MSKIGKTINSVIMFIVLGFFFFLAFQFIQTSHIKPIQESFQVKSASDCNCLPGFIPSNMKGAEKTTNFFCQSLSNSSVTKKCY
jgi:hypothetical protein